MKIIILVFAFILILINCEISQKKELRASCSLEITTPLNNSQVSDNKSLQHLRPPLFGFTVTGNISNLGRHKICIYQKVPNGTQWFRSGDAITSAEVTNNGTWMNVYLSCGLASNPHPICLVKAVVANDCPPSGSNHINIPEYICASDLYSYRTR